MTGPPSPVPPRARIYTRRFASGVSARRWIDDLRRAKSTVPDQTGAAGRSAGGVLTLPNRVLNLARQHRHQTANISFPPNPRLAKVGIEPIEDLCRANTTHPTGLAHARGRSRGVS